MIINKKQGNDRTEVFYSTLLRKKKKIYCCSIYHNGKNVSHGGAVFIPNSFADFPLLNPILERPLWASCSSGIPTSYIEQLCQNNDYKLHIVTEQNIEQEVSFLTELLEKYNLLENRIYSILNKDIPKIVFYLDELSPEFYSEEFKKRKYCYNFSYDIHENNKNKSILYLLNVISRFTHCFVLTNITNDHIPLLFDSAASQFLLRGKRKIIDFRYVPTILDENFESSTFGIPYKITNNNKDLLWLLNHEIAYSFLLWDADNPSQRNKTITEFLPSVPQCVDSIQFFPELNMLPPICNTEYKFYKSWLPRRV